MRRLRLVAAILLALAVALPALPVARAYGGGGGHGPGAEVRVSWRPPVRYGVLSGILAYHLERLTASEGPPWAPLLGHGLLVTPSRVFPAPKTIFGRNVKVSVDYSAPYESEPSIAVNPRNPNNIVVAGHQEIAAEMAMGPSPEVTLGIYYSMDGGETWHGPIIAKAYDPLRDIVIGDVALGSASDGTFYMTYLSVGNRPLPPPLNTTTGLVSTIMLGVSRDGGKTWNFTAALTPDYINVSKLLSEGYYPIGILLDKDYLAVGKSPITGKTMLVVSYTEFLMYVDMKTGTPFYNVTIKAIVSHDGGKTWIGPKALSPTVKINLSSPFVPRLVQGSYPAVAPNGTIYVAYYDSLDDGWLNGSAAVMVVRSDDGGKTWSKPVEAAVIPHEIGYYYTVKIGETLMPTFRWWSSMFPSIAVAPDGTVYIAYSADPDGPGCDPADVYLVYSKNWGKTWSIPVRVNDDPRGSCNAQFFPWVVAGEDSSAHIVWADTRLSVSRMGYDIYYARFHNGKLSPNYRVTDYTSWALENFIGDYINAAEENGTVYVVWTDARRGFYFPVQTPIMAIGVDNTDIFFAKTGKRPPATVTLSAPIVEPGGVTIEHIEASGLPAYSTIPLLLNGVFLDILTTDSKGRASATVTLPPLSPGVYNMSLVGIVSYASYTTVPVIVTNTTAAIIAYMDSKTSSLHAELSTLEEGLTITMLKVDTLAANVSAVARGLQALEKGLTGLSSRVDLIEAAVSNITKTQESLKAKVDEAVMHSRIAEKIVWNLNSTLPTRIKALQGKVTAIQDTVNSLAGRLGSLQSSISSLKTGLDQQSKKLDQLASTLSEARASASKAYGLSAATLALVVVTLIVAGLGLRRH